LKVKSLISQFKISLESFINILTQEEDRTLWLEDKVDKLEHLDNNKE
jgi:bacterioferritin (cytochrome b1)